MNPQNVLRSLQRCPQYRPTPLQDAPDWANRMGVAQVWLKLESERMGLGSFKALGGAYAVACLSQRAEPGVELLIVCASAGNHGLSVAAGARHFGAQALIVLSETVPAAFARRLSEQGAEVVRAGQTYEESMAAAQELAHSRGGVLLADSSWEGYREIPTLVMEGYTVISHELSHQFADLGAWPEHVFLQAGVGGLAGALTFHIRSQWSVQPTIWVVEPEAAPCLKESVRLGRPCRVEGPLSSMGRLDCKEASQLAFEILSQQADHFVTVSDHQAEAAARLVGPSSTSSAAAGLAAALEAKLSPRSRVLCLLTEGF